MKNNIKTEILKIVLKKGIRDIQSILKDFNDPKDNYDFLSNEEQELVDFFVEYLNLEMDDLNLLEELQEDDANV